MQRLCLTIILGLAFWALAASPQGLSSAAAVEADAAGTQAKCLKAENPCRENPRAEGDWSFMPTCQPAAPAGS